MVAYEVHPSCIWGASRHVAGAARPGSCAVVSHTIYMGCIIVVHVLDFWSTVVGVNYNCVPKMNDMDNC